MTILLPAMCAPRIARRRWLCRRIMQHSRHCRKIEGCFRRSFVFVVVSVDVSFKFKSDYRFCIIFYGQGGETNYQMLVLCNRNCTTECLRNCLLSYSQVCNRHSQYHNRCQLARLNCHIEFR